MEKKEWFTFGTQPDGSSIELRKDKAVYIERKNGNVSETDVTDTILNWVEEYKKFK